MGIISISTMEIRIPTVDGSEIPFPTTWDGAKTRRI